MSKKKIALMTLLSLLAVIVLAALSVLIYAVIAFNTVGESGLPRIDVVTENKSASIGKKDYVSCKISLTGASESYDFSEAQAGIRGRGNSTWQLYPKKPYRIKFDEKTSMFGEAPNKSWVLLALYNDFSFIKDALAFSLADSLGTDDFVPSYNYVELYINGSYKGLYLLTDQVEAKEGRVDVEYDFSPEDTEVPFLVELDEYAPNEGEEGVDYFTLCGRYYALKYPKSSELYSEEQFEYIKNYISEVDRLTRKKNVTLEEISSLVDIGSFIDFYLVQELMGQTEINFKSVYMSKAVDGKLKMGPIWDFDWAVNGPYLYEYKNINIDRTEGFCSGNNFFGNLYNNSPEFRSALYSRYAEVRDKLVNTIDRLDSEKERLANAARKDKIRWHLIHFDADFEERSDEVIDWLYRRIEWLDKELRLK